MRISTVALITLALSLQAGPGFAQNQSTGGAPAGTAGSADQGGGGSPGATTGTGNGDQGAQGTGADSRKLRPAQRRPGSSGQRQTQQGKPNPQGGAAQGQTDQGGTGQGTTNQVEPRKKATGQGQHRQGQTNQTNPPNPPKINEANPPKQEIRQGGQRTNAGEQGQVRQGRQKVTIGTEQRTRISETIKTLNVRPVTNLSVRIAVGVVIPRRVRLLPLPPAIIEIVPELRSFRYVLVPGRILIVDPATFEIVEIIEI